MKKYDGPQAEIERKFLLKRMPDLEPANMRQIWHYYIDGARYTMDKYEDGRVKYVKCIKTPLEVAGGNAEDENPITQEEFEKITEGQIPLVKNRCHFEIEGHVWEVDYFFTVCLIMAEVEWIFPLDAIDMDQVNSFKIPDIMLPLVIAEVTGIPGFSNYQLSL